MTQFTRYTIISGLTWLIDFVLFMVLYDLTSIPAALLLSRIAAGVFAFVAHKAFSFSSRSSITQGEVVGYASLALLNYVLSVAFISAFPTGTWERAGIAKIVIEFVIFVLNFLFLRRLFIRE